MGTRLCRITRKSTTLSITGTGARHRRGTAGTCRCVVSATSKPKSCTRNRRPPHPAAPLLLHHPGYHFGAPRRRPGQMCPYAHTDASNEKWTSASALRKPPYACSLRRQVPGVPSGLHHPTLSRGKRLRGSPTSPPPTPSEEGSAIFSISSALDVLDPECHAPINWDISSWLNGPSYPCCYPHPQDVQE